MTKKKIIGLCIGAVVLVVLRPVWRKAAGWWSIAGCRMSLRMRWMHSRPNKRWADPADDCCGGWYLRLVFPWGRWRAVHESLLPDQKRVQSARKLHPVNFLWRSKKELLADDKVWSRTTGAAKNQVHAEYLEGEDDMTVSFDVYYQCEGSCGEYFADITVTDSETGKLYYSSEAENEAAE